MFKFTCNRFPLNAVVFEYVPFHSEIKLKANRLFRLVSMFQSLSSSFDRQSFLNGISLIIIIAFVLSITPSNVKCSGREYKFCAQTYLHGLITLDNAIYLQFANGIWRYFDGEQRLPTYDKTLRQLFYFSNPFSGKFLAQ